MSGIRDEQGRFLPGCSGNPAGPGKFRGEIAAIVDKAKSEWISDVHALTQLTKDELKKIIDDKSVPIRRLMIASILHKAITKGDVNSYQAVEGRILGKHAQKIELSGGLGLSEMPREKIEEALRDPEKLAALQKLSE